MNREVIERMADDVLGGELKAQRWLMSPNVALGGARPTDVLDRDEGAEVVELLQRIEHGIYS